MSFKASLSWPGWCLLVLLLVLDSASLGLTGSDLWKSISQAVALEDLGVPSGPAVPTVRQALLAQLSVVTILFNVAAFPFLLLSLRLRRDINA